MTFEEAVEKGVANLQAWALDISPSRGNKLVGEGNNRWLYANAQAVVEVVLNGFDFGRYANLVAAAKEVTADLRGKSKMTKAEEDLLLVVDNAIKVIELGKVR